MTTTDLQEHIGVIDRMKSLLNSADFDQVFSLLTSDLPKSKQFLLKMELKRMAQPCNFFIDLRGHVDGEVKPYEYMGKTHYMDDNAIRVFEAGLKQYGGYTLGLYEEVLNTENNFRVMHRKQTEERVRNALQQTPGSADSTTEPTAAPTQWAKLIRFGNYTSRRDERMHFSIDVELEFNQQRIKASTSDLSVSGCKLKLNSALPLTTDSVIKLHFTGLEQEFMLGLSQGVSYKVVDSEQQANAFYLRLKRLPDENETQFADFLQRFINGNKRRYKVNLDSVSQSLLSKGYEQFYLPRSASLPVFIAVKDNRPIPVCALTTDYNKSVWQYFLDEQHQAMFINICHTKRLKALLQQNSHDKSTILYCFTHAVKGKLFFYSATREELALNEQTRQLFLGFGASKASWRVFHLNLQRTSPATAEMPSTVPQADNNKPAAGLTPLVKHFIQDLRYIVSLTDITATESAFWYQNYPVDQQQLKLLAAFGHKKLAQQPQCEAVAVQYVNLRSESRYLYKTSVTIADPEQQSELNGHSRDFSSKGMQVETTLPVRFNKGDVVLLNLPDMQKISNKYSLSGLPYEIMAVSKSRTIMNLRAAEGTEPHPGRLFFQQLIQNNRAKLTPAEESPKYPGLSVALRNMYLSAQNHFVLFVHRKGIRYEINTLAQGNAAISLQLLLTQPKHDDKIALSPLLQNNAASLHFAQQLKHMKRLDNARVFELFVQVKEDSDQGLQLTCRYDYEFGNEQHKQQFVLNASSGGSLFCYRLLLSRTGRPDIDFIATELNYVSAYAIHKAKKLEEELWSVAGVIDAIDISAEVLWRYGASAEHSEQHEQRRLALLAKLQQPVT
ncbi:MAG: PilZ domain-containing protein [Chromatiaceae bacterium]|nr:PilZ domain-containing protein [Chromatiaceae bacterium]